MRITIPAIVAVAVLIILTISAFIAYNYLYMSVEFPDNFVYIGKTINTSELYHTDKFSWTTYNQINNWAAKNGSVPILQITSEWSDQMYNGTPAKRYREIARDQNGTLLQITDTYWDAANLRFLASPYQAYQNGILTNGGSFNVSTPYEKEVRYLPYGFRIAPRGIETITVGNKSYVCNKYYLPNQNVNGGGCEPAMYWFNDSIPVPVKVQPTGYNHVPPRDGYVVFELVGWG